MVTGMGFHRYRSWVLTGLKNHEGSSDRLPLKREGQALLVAMDTMQQGGANRPSLPHCNEHNIMRRY